MSDFFKVSGVNLPKQSRRSSVSMSPEKQMRIIRQLKEKHSQPQLKDESDKENMVLGGPYKKIPDNLEMTAPKTGGLKMNERFPQPPVLRPRNEQLPRIEQSRKIHARKPKLSSTEEMMARYHKGLEQLRLQKEIEKPTAITPPCSKQLMFQPPGNNASVVFENCADPLPFPSDFNRRPLLNVAAAERWNSVHENWRMAAAKRRPIWGCGTMIPHEQRPKRLNTNYTNTTYFRRTPILDYEEAVWGNHARHLPYHSAEELRIQQNIDSYNLQIQRQRDLHNKMLNVRMNSYARTLEAERRRVQETALRKLQNKSTEEDLSEHLKNMALREPRNASAGSEFYEGYKQYELGYKTDCHPASSEQLQSTALPPKEEMPSNSGAGANAAPALEQSGEIEEGPDPASNSPAKEEVKPVIQYSIDELKMIGASVWESPEYAFRKL